MSRSRSHGDRRLPKRVPYALTRQDLNCWMDWPHAGPAPGRSLVPFVRAAKRSERQQVLRQIYEDARGHDVCGEHNTCDFCLGLAS